MEKIISNPGNFPQGTNQVLIVDDQPDNLRLLSNILTGQGCEVRPAPNGRAALEAIKHRLPDLILLDIRMPEMDGFEVCRRLKADERTRDVPIIFISALKETGDKVKAFQAGGVDYITKPIQEGEVLARVEIHLSLRRLQKELEFRVNERTAELNQSNKILKENEERLALAIEATGAGIYDHPVPLGPGTYHSERWANILGYEKEELPSLEDFLEWLAGLVHPDDLSKLEKAYSDFVEGRTETYVVEIRMRHKSGKWIYVQYLSRAVERDALGNVKRVVGVMQDITEQKLVEEELKKHRERLEELVRFRTEDLEKSRKAALNLMQDANMQRQRAEEALEALQKSEADLARAQAIAHLGSYVWNIQSGEIVWSDELQAIWGLNKKKPSFELVTSMIHPDDRERIMEAGRLARVENHPFNVQYRILRPDGSMRYIHDQGQVTRDEAGNAIRMFGIVSDITERKRMEEELIIAKEKAEDATRAKSEFLTNMSHEIRTPMNAIIGMTHLAFRTDLTDKQQDYLDKILASSHTLQGIIDDILDFSKIEAGKLDIESIDFDLSDVLENLANMSGFYAQERGLDLVLDSLKNVPNHLVGDPLRLGQVLLNLTNNAVKFTESGEIVVSAELVKKASKTVTIKFSVKDTGIGMAKKQISRLFQPFSQMDSSTTRRYGGSGLGLSISKALVDRMGGEIWVESKPGQGSTFYFTARFGIQEAKKRKDHKTAPLSLIELESLRGIHILLVEDNEINRQVAVEILENEGVRVTTANNGQEAIQEIKQAGLKKDLDVVLMDLQMPVIDGYEATREVRKIRGFEKLPIIAMTAHAVKGVQDKCLKSGMNDYITKPIDTKILYSVLARWIKPERVKTISRKKRIDKAEEPEKSQFPKIAGINLEAAVKHVAGNKEFYINLLQKFRKNFSSFTDEFNELVDSGQKKEAILLAHNLKGVAGILGAEVLQLNAGTLEDSLEKGKEKDVEAHLKKVNSKLKQLLKEIDRAGIIHVQGKPQETTEQKVGLKELKNRLDELKRLLEGYESNAVNYYANIRHLLTASGFLDESKELEEGLDRYDFDKAIRIVTKIESKLKRRAE